MGKVNRFLMMLIAMAAIMIAAVGIDRGMQYYSARKWEKERVARYEQAYADVADIEMTISSLSQDQKALEDFIEEHRDYFENPADYGEGISSGENGAPADSPGGSGSSAQAEGPESLEGTEGMGFWDAWEESVSGNAAEGEEGFLPGVSGNALSGVSGSRLGSISGNELMDVSGNRLGSVSGNGLFDVSGNRLGSVSVNGLFDVSGNCLGSVSGNGLFDVSGNRLGDIFGNELFDVLGGLPGGISSNELYDLFGRPLGSASENDSDGVWESGQESRAELPSAGSGGKTLLEKRQVRASYMETRIQNNADLRVIAESSVDFSDISITCLGDSITEAANLSDLEDYQQYSYPTRLGELLGAGSVTNLGIGGSSVGRYWENAFADRYKEIPRDTDLIIVMGGTNDGFCMNQEELGTMEERRERTFIGDLDELMRGLKEDYPDAQVVFVTPLPNVLHDILRKERDYLLPQTAIVNTIKLLAKEYEIPVIDLYNSNILDTHDAAIIYNYMPDGVHCNSEGYRLLAEHIAAELIKIYEEAEESGQLQEARAEGNNLYF